MEYRPDRSYPTKLLRPTSQSRLLREVVWVEMEHLAKFRLRPDIAATIESVHHIAKVFRRLAYSVPELLTTFQSLDPYQNRAVKSKSKSVLVVTPEMVPWETIPEELITKCLDDNLELQVIPELLDYLGLSQSEGRKSGDGLTPSRAATERESVFGRVAYTSRRLDPEKDREKIVRVPIYNKEGRRISTQYCFFDEELGEFRKAIIRGAGDYSTERAYQEVDFVVDMFSTEQSSVDLLGVSRELLLQTLWSLFTFIKKYRKEYYSVSYLERLVKYSPEELREQREAAEKEYALSRNGVYIENTERLWSL